MDAEIGANGLQVASTKQYSIGQRMMVFRDSAEFLKFYNRARQEVAREQAAESSGDDAFNPSRVLVRF
jgi:hypothetical protein